LAYNARYLAIASLKYDTIGIKKISKNSITIESLQVKKAKQTITHYKKNMQALWLY